MALVREKCVACRRDSPRITNTDIAKLHPTVPEWCIKEIACIKRLCRTFHMANFAEAMAFANHVGDSAETEGHHPTLVVEWGKLSISWWTHKIKGLHRNDFVMAAKTDELFKKYMIPD